MDVELGRFGRIVTGDMDEGYYVHIAGDGASGFLVYVVDDLADPSAGGDYWTDDLAAFFHREHWQVEWLDERCEACCRPA